MISTKSNRNKIEADDKETFSGNHPNNVLELDELKEDIIASQFMIQKSSTILLKKRLH